MSKLAKALTAAAGNAGGAGLMVEDVFSTYLYEGTGTAQTITNGIDLDGEGGMVWIKCRNTAFNNIIFDTERGAPNALLTNTTDQNISFYSDSLTSFNSDGFSLGADTISFSVNNGSNRDYCSWTFRKAEKFFDVVTYTGNGVAGREIAHNLGSAPAFVMVKRTNTSNNWICWHSALTNTQYIQINATSEAFSDGGIFWDSTTPDASNLTLGSDSGVNGSGSTYVAYLFASDAGGFGDDGSESIIKCGSYEGNGLVDGPSIDLGWEPQYLIIKNADGVDDWKIYDSMRGIVSGGDGSFLAAQSSTTETALGKISLNANGFKIDTNFALLNASANTFIYIAIRRPMKTPESGTEVFAIGTNQEVPSATSGFYSGFPVDMAIKRIITAGQPNYLFDRLRGGQALVTNTDAAESAFGAAEFDHQNGWYYDSDSANTNDYSWMFKRATGFFDVVAYTGDGTSDRSINHNLGVTPELIIGRIRSGQTDYWGVWQASLGDQGMYLAGTNSAGVTLVVEGHTSSIFKVSNGYGINNVSTLPHIAYLFGSVAGVSKVGSYTGTGADLNVDCGFSAGARFILIKRTDSASQWYLWDSARGIVAGNDPWIELNNTNAQNSGQDAIDPLASGFTVTAAANVNQPSGNYIFLAIA
jgi:hypothetical protein